MRATHGSAATGPATAHAKVRRQPPVRGAPPPLKKRRPWTDEEVDQLDRLYRGSGADVDYQKLAEDLGTGRTSDMVRSKVTALGLRDRVARTAPGAAGASAWEAQRGKHWAAQRGQHSTLTSPSTLRTLRHGRSTVGELSP
jgi:hypothetical protein